MRLTGKIHSDNLHKRLEGYRKGMKRKDISPSMNPAYEDMSYVSQHELVYEKLGQLEDIEEELGIDLVTLFKALKDGFYRYRPTAINNVICFIAKPKVNMKQKCFTYGSYGKSYFKDYGKTWALTKEELKDEK